MSKSSHPPWIKCDTLSVNRPDSGWEITRSCLWCSVSAIVCYFRRQKSPRCPRHYQVMPVVTGYETLEAYYGDRRQIGMPQIQRNGHRHYHRSTFHLTSGELNSDSIPLLLSLVFLFRCSLYKYEFCEISYCVEKMKYDDIQC
jgi:hypothetical protein